MLRRSGLLEEYTRPKSTNAEPDVADGFRTEA